MVFGQHSLYLYPIVHIKHYTYTHYINSIRAQNVEHIFMYSDLLLPWPEVKIPRGLQKVGCSILCRLTPKLKYVASSIRVSHYGNRSMGLLAKTSNGGLVFRCFYRTCLTNQMSLSKKHMPWTFFSFAYGSLA